MSVNHFMQFFNYFIFVSRERNMDFIQPKKSTLSPIHLHYMDKKKSWNLRGCLHAKEVKLYCFVDYVITTWKTDIT